MPEVSAPVGKSRERRLLSWAITATFAAVVFLNVALYFFARVRELEAAQKNSTRNAAEKSQEKVGKP